MSEEKHPTTVHLSPKQLAVQLAGFRYDALADLLTHLQDELSRASDADVDRDRPLLASALSRASIAIGRAAQDIECA